MKKLQEQNPSIDTAALQEINRKIDILDKRLNQLYRRVTQIEHYIQYQQQQWRKC